MIGQLQQKLTELSHNPSPAVGPVNGGRGGAGQGGDLLDMDALGLGLAAIGGAGHGGDAAVEQRSKRVGSASTGDGREVTAEFAP